MTCLCLIVNSVTPVHCTGVPVRLLGKSQFYLDSNASQYIVQTIETGYKLVFITDTPPPSFMKRNNLSALNQSDFVYNEFLRLEKLGCIKRVDYVYSKKWRCVLDASVG